MCFQSTTVLLVLFSFCQILLERCFTHPGKKVNVWTKYCDVLKRCSLKQAKLSEFSDEPASGFCNAAERVLNKIVLFNMCIAATATGQVKRSGHQKVHLSKDLFLPHLGSSYPKYTSTLQYLILDKPISICSRAGFFRVGAETDTGDGKPLISSMSGWQPSHPAKHRIV